MKAKHQGEHLKLVEQTGEVYLFNELAHEIYPACSVAMNHGTEEISIWRAHATLHGFGGKYIRGVLSGSRFTRTAYSRKGKQPASLKVIGMNR